MRPESLRGFGPVGTNGPESFDAVLAEMREWATWYESHGSAALATNLRKYADRLQSAHARELAEQQAAHAAEVAEQQATIESLRDILYEAVGDDAKDWESGDGWPMGRFLVPALSRDYNKAASEFAAYIAERVYAAAGA